MKLSKQEFFSAHLLEGSLAILAVDENSGESETLYEVFLDYREMPLEEFLKKHEFKNEQECLDYFLLSLDIVSSNIRKVKGFIKKRRKTL